MFRATTIRSATRPGANPPLSALQVGQNTRLDAAQPAFQSHRYAGLSGLACLGPFTRFHVRVNEETTLPADVPSQHARDFYVAQAVVLSFSPTACQVLPLDAGAVELEKLAEAEKV